MNYNVLRYFSVLAEVEHFTVAAARLGITQPSLSSAIRNLEDALGGVKLFERKGRRIRLTDEGRYYQEEVNFALEKLHNASRTLRNSKLSAPIVIRMGVVSGMLEGVVSQKIAECKKQNERIRFHITESSSDYLMDMVRHERLDMAIVDATDRDRTLHFRKLNERDFFVAMPKGHPLCDREELNPREIVNEPQVVFNYNVGKSFKEWTSGTPTDESVLCTVDTAQSALDLVSAGIGIAFLPDQCVRKYPGVQYVPLTNWHQALYMCTLYDKWLEPPIWDFIEVLVKAVRESDNTSVN